MQPHQLLNYRGQVVSPEPEKNSTHPPIDDESEAGDAAHHASLAAVRQHQQQEAEKAARKKAYKEAEEAKLAARNLDWKRLSELVWPEVS